MKYVSTRGASPAISFEDVLISGPAPDGGLYVPQTWPTFDATRIRNKPGATYADLAAAVTIATDQLKVADAAGKIARFQELVAKWTAIVEELNGDADAIAARVQSEVWDKVDYTTYGL